MSSTVIYNAKAYLAKGQFAQAILIQDGMIRAVGSNQSMLAAAPADARRYDAAGRTVVPGFNDSHMHLLSKGELLGSVQLLGVGSIAEMQQRVREYIARHNTAPGTPVCGHGWNQDYFAEGRLPTCHDLDAVSTRRPIVLERACAHILVANTLAMQLAGITPGTPAAPGGAIDHDEAGRPTGIFRENATAQITRILPPRTQADIEASLRLAMDHAARHGLTSVQTMDLRPSDWQQVLAAYRQLQSGQPTLRVYHQCNFSQPEDFAAFLAQGLHTGVGDAWNRIGPLKMFVDGSLGARTALMRADYHDAPGVRGISTMPPAQMQRMMAMAQAHGCQVVVHAIGDGAIQQVLDGYDALCQNGENPLRFGVVHCQITDLPLLRRFTKNNILALVQPIFLHYDMTIVQSRVGEALAATSYAFETLRRLGVPLSFGTDCPVEELDPINNLYCAVTRQNLAGSPAGGFYPAERMDICDAVDAYTLGSAYASFEENVKGRIRPGYYADLAVLSADIFTLPPEQLRTAQVDATMVGGRFVYER